ncbi:MAG TPA: PfkB family carbohydrate kinase [Methylomirabilota bacterium]|jgi:sulfofructose kinase|nr:PfkB family carbohydrate kinase [Methylomirabilota bacterium]
MRVVPGPPSPVDVVGLGSNALDLLGVIDGHPQPDTKAPLRQFEVQGGGMVATALVACARLGLRARYLGKFGDDYWARLARRLLARDGVDVRHALRARGSVGHVSIMLIDAQTGLRTGFYRRPPAYDVRPDELDRAVVTSGRLLHLDGVDAAAAVVAVRWAREAGMRITMDGERVVDGIDAVWPAVDLLAGNPRFVAQVTGRTDPEEGLAALAARGPARVAVTLAAEGAIGLENGRLVRAPGFSVPVVDTNGAGDVFHGACAVGELRGWPLARTLTFANAVAAMKCGSLGGRRGIPRLPAVAAFLAERGHPELAAEIRAPGS